MNALIRSISEGIVIKIIDRIRVIFGDMILSLIVSANLERISDDLTALS